MSDSLNSSEEEVLTAVRNVGYPHEPLTTSEVADSLDCARRTAYNKLDSLAERNIIKTKKVGARGRIWWRPKQVVPEKKRYRTGTGQPIGQASIGSSSERKHLARSRQIDRKALGSLVRAVDDYAIFTLDPDGYVVNWNAGAEQLKGYSTKDILGEHFSTFYTEDDRAAGVPEQNLQEAAANGSTEDEGWRVCADGSRFWASITIIPSRNTDGKLDGYVKIVHDLTEQKQREREVRKERTLLEAMFEHSPVGILLLDEDGTIRRANDRAADLLGLTPSEIEGRAYDDPSWEIWQEDGVPIASDEHPVTRVLESRDPVLEFTHGITLSDGSDRWLSSNSAPIIADDGTVERVIVGLEDITELKRHEQQIDSQRSELRRLERVNASVRGISTAMTEVNTRDEVENKLCEVLASSEPYLFAVVGQFSSSYTEFSPNASAGISDDYLDDIIDSRRSPPLDEGPGAKAAKTGDVQVVQDITDLPYDYWQTAAESNRFHSYAAVPLVYQGVVYGVAGVYAHEPAAFDAKERVLLAEIGEIAGYKLHAIETTRQLRREQMIELRLQSEELARPFLMHNGIELELTADRFVQIDEDTVVQYHTVKGIPPQEGLRILRNHPATDDVQLLRTTEGSFDVEIRQDPESVVSIIARHRGEIQSVSINDGTLVIDLQLPRVVDHQRVITRLQDRHPDIEVVSEQLVFTERTLEHLAESKLTDRQLTAMELAFAAGYFEQPRQSSGGDIADRMGVTKSTFHRHLRHAEKRIVETILDPSWES